MADAAERKAPHWLERATVQFAIIGAVILIWQYAPINPFHKMFSVPGLAILALLFYGQLRPRPAFENRRASRRYFLKDGVWQILTTIILIAVSVAVIFYEPVGNIAPTWLRIVALIMLFAGPFTIAGIIFETLYFMAFPPKDVPPDTSSKTAQDALARNLAKEGVARPRPSPNPDTAQPED